MISNRRNFLGSAGLAATAALLPGCNKSNDDTAGKFERQFDWSKPEDNLTAFVKVMGDLNGSSRIWSAQGTIYGRRPDHMTIPIMRVEGARFTKFDKIDGGYRMWTRDWVIFRDLKTYEILESYENPFTGKTNEVKQILTNAYSWDMTPDNGQVMPSYTGEGWLIGKPLSMPWVEEGDHSAVTLELLVKYANGVVGGELEHFLFSTKELHDPTLTSVSATQAWVGNSPWLRWMDMKDAPGGTQWHSTGLKHHDYEGLRPEFRAAVNRFYPGSLEDPEGYKKPEVAA